jgi:NtrC-family two-component system response regulator AlgB
MSGEPSPEQCAIKRGKVEDADGGRCSWTRLAKFPPNLQTKLLRFAQDRQFERIGDTQTRRSDVRLITATNRDLEAMSKAGVFVWTCCTA